MYLRAGAKYIDGHSPSGIDPEKQDKITEDDTGVSANDVQMKDYQNTAPMFVGADGKATTTATTTRRVLENTEAGTAIRTSGGGKLTSTRMANEESLTYSAGRKHWECLLSTWPRAQIRVGDQTDLNYEDHGSSQQLTTSTPLRWWPPTRLETSGTSTVTIKVINVNEAPELVEDHQHADNLAAATIDARDRRRR